MKYEIAVREHYSPDAPRIKVEIDATLVPVEGFEEWEFIVHPTTNEEFKPVEGQYTLSELSSGFSVVSFRETEEDAIEIGTALLKTVTPERFRDVVAKAHTYFETGKMPSKVKDE